MATPRPARRRRQATPKEKAAPSFHPKGVPAAAPPKTAETLPPKAHPRTRRDGDEQAPRAGRFPKDSVAWLILLSALSYASGWYIAYTGAPLFPGFFLASDLGLATALALLLRTLSRITRSRIPTDGLAVPSAAVPKAAAWSVLVFWFFAMFTQVFQLAIGLGVGIVAYQLYATRSRLQREGYAHATRFGPAFAPTVWVLGSYVGWYVVRRLAGWIFGFDVVTLGGLALLVVLTIRATDRAALAHVRTPKRVADPKDRQTVRRDLERRTIAGVIIGYLFFRFFISSAIPYGPIVEWLLVCVGALFIAIAMADRIGVVPTRRGLPHPDMRVHVQRIHSLPDRSLEEADEHLGAFIGRGQDATWVHDRFAHLFEEAGVSPADRRRHLAPFRAEGRRRHPPVDSMGLEARERLVADLLGVLRRQRQRGATGTLKTDPGVRKDDKTGPDAVRPNALATS